MIKTKPGPWKVGIYRDDPSRPPTADEIKSWLCDTVDNTIDYGGSIEDYYAVMSSDDPLDPIYVALTGNGPTSAANAVMIAALPDLLEASKAFCALFEYSAHNPDSPLAKLKAAIAKAEGKDK